MPPSVSDITHDSFGTEGRPGSLLQSRRPFALGFTCHLPLSRPGSAPRLQLSRNAVYSAHGLKTLPRILSPEQVQQILSVLGLREQLIVRLALFSGMRPGEILALQWKHIADDHV